MESNDGEDHSQKLLLAQTHIWNHFFSFINSMSLKCAIELNILDVVHNYGQPMPLSELIASLPIQPSKAAFVPRLMRILTLSGFFSNQNDDDQQEESNKSPLEMEHGRAFWEFASHDQKLGNSFHEAMTSDSRLIASVVIEKCKDTFEGLESLVDVGGGNGTMAKAIAKSFPNVECIVFDLPHVVAGFQGSSDNKNMKYVGGDMFEAIPSADSVLLKVSSIII
ncbi:hypothetical protein AAHE18_03G127100 [Arachis hypogaea]